MYSKKINNVGMQLISTGKIKSNLSMKLVYIWYQTDVPVVKLKKQHVIEISTEIVNLKLVNVVYNLYTFGMNWYLIGKIEREHVIDISTKLVSLKLVNFLPNRYTFGIKLISYMKNWKNNI